MARLGALLALVLLLGAPARAEVLWRGDFSGDWMTRWNVTRIVKLEARLDIEEDERLGAFLRVTFPPDIVKQGYAFRADLSERIGSRERVYLSYHVRFSPGFDWQSGGKLPGLMTRLHGPVAGCNQPDGTGGFSTRYVWGPRGAIRLYPYVPPQEHYRPSARGCAIGHRLDATLETGRWVHLVQMVELNTPGRADGTIRAWVDGRFAGELPPVRLRDAPFGIGGIMFSTFYGGSCCAPDAPGNTIDFAAFSIHDSNPLGEEADLGG